MTMLPTSGDRELYANLDSAAALLVRSDHMPEAIPFLTTLANATPWNSEYRLRLAQAQLKVQQDTASANANLTNIASTRLAPYAIRTTAAIALKLAPGAKDFDSAELTLLASPNSISQQQANQPYFLPARIAAAETASSAAKPAILREAIAVAPSDSLRLAIFRAEATLGQSERALVAIRPLIQLPYGYMRPQDSSAERPYSLADTDDSVTPVEITPLPTILRTREEKLIFALTVATVFEKTGSPAEAVSYLRTAATLNHDPTRANAIAIRIATLDAQLHVDVENNSRRPVIQPALDQTVIVRPRITQASISMQKVQP